MRVITYSSKLRDRVYTRRPLEERFWEKVARSGPDDCWIWTAARSPLGYGKFSLGFKQGTAQAHRLSYALANGDFDPALSVCHRCDNPSCVNPAHLFLGTHTENMRDAIKKGRFQDPVNGVVNRRKTHCKRGHEFTPENTYTHKRMRHCRTCSRERMRERRAAQPTPRRCRGSL